MHVNALSQRLLRMSLWFMPLLLLQPVPFQASLAQTNTQPMLNLNPQPGWFSDDSYITTSVALGDVDNDGDLDLAVGHRDGPSSVRIYFNQNGQIEKSAGWVSTQRHRITSIAWGDVDNDGNLDLAVGNDGEANVLYLNLHGVPATEPSWQSTETDETASIAWGDVNNDGYLDLAVGNDAFGANAEPNRIYMNHGGRLEQTASWVSEEMHNTVSVAWADVDDDGDLDLAVGNDWEPNQLYLNDHGILPTIASWTSRVADRTQAVAWGNVNGDRFPDLAVANAYQPDYLYLSQEGTLPDRPTWTSSEQDISTSLAWGDIDADGDLDLAVGLDGINTGSGSTWGHTRIYLNQNRTFPSEYSWHTEDRHYAYDVALGELNGDGFLDLVVGTDAQDKLYITNGHPLSQTAAWSSSDTDRTRAIAWGDVDRDGEMELASGNRDQANLLYQNATGVLQPTASWASGDAEGTTAVAWGDVDGDGDLDLAVANDGAPNKLYRNVEGVLQADSVWISQDSDDSTGIAWGDIDGDGDLDLAVSNDNSPNKVYRNIGGTLEPFAWWQSDDEVRNMSLTLGDIDRDGDLDLITGIRFRANQLYINHAQQLSTTAIPIGQIEDETSGVALGDVDGDGDLDLAVGNLGGPNRVYRNENGAISDNNIWNSSDSDHTRSVAWGDWDGDGDLDLAAGNSDGANKVYRNENGILQTANVWSSVEADDTYSVAWGDWDNDGDLDLATGNTSGPNRIYWNQQRIQSQQLGHPPYAIINTPQQGAYFAAIPTIIHGDKISITYTLINHSGTSYHRIIPQYAIDGGSNWQFATPISVSETISRAASPAGVTHTFHWQISADPVIRNNTVHFRLLVMPETNHSPILWPATATQSQPFRYAAPWYAKVVDETGNPLTAATIYRAGKPYTQSNHAGLVQLETVPIGTELATLALQHEQPTLRDHHDGWAYRVYTTNLSWTNESEANLFTVTDPGEQRLTVSPTNTLILFNLLISIEWDADAAYLAEIEEMARRGSNYLFDLTDGQMALGKVTIVDNAEQWADADVRIFAQNRFRPYATHGGILKEPDAGGIHLGRQWDRNRGPGSWREPDGYRTFIHEFGHYALHLYDEYFVHIFEDGSFVGRAKAFCVKHKDELTSDLEGNSASAMYWQYGATEFSAAGVNNLWPPAYSDNCEWTEQWQRTKRELGLERGESAWETLARVYRDQQQEPSRWQIVTPIDRGHLLAGPTGLPSVLPAWPTVATTNAGTTAVPNRTLTVAGPEASFANAFVTLETTGGRTINQGFTSISGTIDIYGAVQGDQLVVTSRNGRFTGSMTVRTDPNLTINLVPFIGSHSAETAPMLFPLLSRGDEAQEIYATDGTATMYFEPGAISTDDLSDDLSTDSPSSKAGIGIATNEPLPAALPDGFQLQSNVYTVISTVSSTTLAKPAILEIQYDATMTAPETLYLYHYDAQSNAWQPLSATLDTEESIIYTTVHELGTYVLLQTEQIKPNFETRIFLPSVMR